MKRSEWTFEYTATDLHTAAEQEYQKRAIRADYWKAERQKVMEELKETGLTISQWDAYTGKEGITKTGISNRVDVEFDEKLMTRLRNCEHYLEKARNEKSEYKMWMQVFGDTSPSKTFDLHAVDVAYFGLGQSVEPDFPAAEDPESAESELTA